MPDHMPRRRLGPTLAVTGAAVAAWAGALVANRSLRRVEGPSMLPLLHPGDLVATRPHLPGVGAGVPRRGDLVVVAMGTATAIKRVVGLPGDTVVLGDGHLHVDGSWWELPGAVLVDEDVRFQVGADEVVVLGDNRAWSTDSRDVGPVPLANVERIVVVGVRPWRRLGAGVGMRRVAGPRTREAVRVVVVGPDDRTLLFRVRDADGGDAQWWETPGGGLLAGEDVATAAARELHEEVGTPHGPIVSLDHVATRASTVWGTDLHRVEHTMATRVTSTEVVTENWTPGEVSDHVDWRWYTRDEVADMADPIHPSGLPALYDRALGLLGPSDGNG